VGNLHGSRTLRRLLNGLAAILYAQHCAPKVLGQSNSACPLARGNIQDIVVRSQIEQRPEVLGQFQPTRVKSISQEQPCPVALINAGATRLYLLGVR
jgi:hypothetical protein